MIITPSSNGSYLFPIGNNYTFISDTLTNIPNLKSVIWRITTSNNSNYGIIYERKTDPLSPIFSVPISYITPSTSISLPPYYVHILYKYSSIHPMTQQVIETTSLIDSKSFFAGKNEPVTPTITFPSTGSISGKNPTFNSSAYVGYGTIQSAEQWKFNSKSVGVWQGFTSPEFVTGFNTYTILQELPINITLTASVRYKSDKNVWSSWSTEKEFNTISLQPSKPIIKSPINDFQFTSLNNITFEGSNYFSSTELKFSEWYISETTSPSTDPNVKIYASPLGQTTVTIPTSLGLTYNKTYYVIVRYIDYLDRASEWSNVLKFRTFIVAATPPVFLNIIEDSLHRLGIYLKAYSGVSTQGDHLKTEFIVSKTSNKDDYVFKTITSTPDIYILTNELESNTTYHIFASFINGLYTSTTYLQSPYSERIYTTNKNKPNKPSIIFPANNATGIHVAIQLISSAYSGDSSISEYVYWQISNNISDFSSPIWEKSTANNYEILSNRTIRCLTTNTPNLSLNTYYYARVKYKDIAGLWSDWSDPCKFKVLAHNIPNTPTITTIDGQSSPATNISLTPTIVASAYAPVVTTDNHISSDWEITESSGVIIAYSYYNTTNKTSWTSSTLPSNRTLYIKVRYRNEENTSEWSSLGTFTTISVKPETPILLLPKHNSTLVPLSPTLVGSIYSGDSSHSSTHWLISPDSAFSGTSYAKVVSSGTLTTILLDITLSPNTNYYSKLRYKSDAGLWSDWSSDDSSGTSKFTTIFPVPGTPTNLTPINNATNISRRPTFTSSIYSGSSTSNHLYSEWQVSIDSNFENIIWTQLSSTDLISIIVGTNGTFTSLLLSDSTQLNSYTDYYWRVRYKNEAGYSAWSTGFKFTTLILVPEKPINVTPIDGKKQVSTLAELISSDYNYNATHLTSTWEVYKIGTSVGTGTLFWSSIDNGTNLTSIIIGTSTGTFSDIGIVELTHGAWYNWKVKYTNSAGDSDYSDITYFSSTVDIHPAPTIENTQLIDVGISGYEITVSDWLGGVYGDHLSTSWEIATGTSFTSSEIIDYEYDSINNLTSWIPNNLSYFTQYYVRSRFRNETDFSSWSSIYSFKTIVDVPNTPSILYPISNSTGVDWIGIIQLQSNTYSSKEIPTYGTHLISKWELSNDSNFSNIIWGTSIVASGTGLLFANIPALTLGTYSYQWIYARVAYSNINGFSNWSETSKFKLLPGKPNTPNIVLPLEDDESFLRESGVIKSSNYIGQGTHTKSDWQICESGSGAIIVWSVKSAYQTSYLNEILVNSLTGNFSGNLSGKVKLNYHTPYKFRVRHQNENSNITMWSDWSEFINAQTTIDIPNRPICISPEDSDNNQYKNPLLIGSDYSGQGTHVASQWEVATDENFTDIVWKGLSINTTSGTSLTRIIINDVNGKFQGTLIGESSLTLNTTYYWKVSYKNEINFSIFSLPFSFKVKENEQDIIIYPTINKKLEYLVDRFITSHISKRHPKFKEFILHWLKYLDANNNKLIFNLTDFNTIKDFYEIVEVFDFAEDIKNARFKNFMSDDAIEVLKNSVYSESNINPEILRFFRSLNAKKGAPISFQILMKALGYEITVSTTGTFTYKITNIDGKIRTTDDVNKFTEVIKLFHPAGMDYSAASELAFNIQKISHPFKRDIYIANNEFLIANILATVWQSEIGQSFAELLGFFTYKNFDELKFDNLTGFLPFDLENTPIINFSSGYGSASLYSEKFRRSFQRTNSSENGTSYFLDTDGIVARFPLTKSLDTLSDNLITDGNFSKWYNYTNLKYWTEFTVGTESISINKSLDSNSGFYACKLINKYTQLKQDNISTLNDCYILDLNSKSNGINLNYLIKSNDLYFNNGYFGTSEIWQDTNFGTTYINSNIIFNSSGTTTEIIFGYGSSFINGTSWILIDYALLKYIKATDIIYNNNGIYNNVYFTYGPFNKENTALYFYGGTNNSYMEIPSSTKYNVSNESFSLSFWIKCNNPSVISDWSKIISIGSATTSSEGLNIYISGSSYSTIGQLKFEISNGTTVLTTTTSSHYINNTWNNVIIEFIGSGNTSIYVNNNLSNTPIINTINGFSNSELLIIGGNESFTGYISDIRYYKRKLTSQEKSLIQVYDWTIE